MAYCAVMLWLLFDRPAAEGPYWEQIRESLNLVPLRTLRLFAGLLDDHRPQLVRAAVVNLAGNVVMFLPPGLLLPAVRRKTTLTGLLLTCGGIIAIIEILQLFTLRGSCDVDDLLLNLLGIAMGYGLYQLLNKRTNA